MERLQFLHRRPAVLGLGNVLDAERHKHVADQRPHMPVILDDEDIQVGDGQFFHGSHPGPWGGLSLRLTISI